MPSGLHNPACSKHPGEESKRQGDILDRQFSSGVLGSNKLDSPVYVPGSNT